MSDPVTPAQVGATASTVATAAAKVGKSFLKSKTFWANVLMAGTAYFGYIPASAAPYAPYIATGVNVLLRFLTKQPINLSLPSVSVN